MTARFLKLIGTGGIGEHLIEPLARYLEPRLNRNPGGRT
jgi:hypothetical protein